MVVESDNCKKCFHATCATLTEKEWQNLESDNESWLEDEFIDELEGYHANRTTISLFCTTSETEGEVVHSKTSLSPPPQ